MPDLIRDLLEAEGIPQPGWSGRNTALLRLAWRMFIELTVLLALFLAFAAVTLLIWTDMPVVQ